MKTQCPNCKTLLRLPREYKGKTIECKRCRNSFIVEKFKKPPIVVPDQIPKKGGYLLAKLWFKCPRAFRTGFLATLGVVPALLLSIYVYSRLLPIATPSPIPPLYQSSYPPSITVARSTLRELCVALGSLEMAASLKSPSLSEGTRSFIRSHLDFKVKFLNTWNMAPPCEKARDALIDAIRAEIDVLNFETDNAQKDKFLLYNKDYMRLLDRSINLRFEALLQIDGLLYKI